MVSIVVPVYNIGEYLPKCIDSILAQQYTDWQLVLVDDGSRDNSPEICDRYAAADHRIEVIHQPNSGVSVARNTGIEAAGGQWLTFIDGDDYVTPTYLSDLLDAASRGDVDTVVSGWIKDDKAMHFVERRVSRDDIFSLYDDRVNYGYILGKLYDMSLVRDHGIEFARGVRWAEDAMFFNSILVYSRGVAVIAASNYIYYTRGDSSVHKLHPHDVEMLGFEASHDLMPVLVDRFGSRVVDHVSPYAYLWRAIMALYQTDMSRKQRLSVMRGIRFNRSYMHNVPQNRLESLLTWLLIHRQWIAIDLILSKYYKK